MTEDDTFNSLRRVPFRRVFISILDPIELGNDIVPEDKYPVIVNAGWDINDFLGIVREEIRTGVSLGDIGMMRSEQWREKYLRTGPI